MMYNNTQTNTRPKKNSKGGVHTYKPKTEKKSFNKFTPKEDSTCSGSPIHYDNSPQA